MASRRAPAASAPGAHVPKVQPEMLRRLGRLGRLLGHAARTVEVLQEGGAPYLKQSLGRKLRSRVQYRQWVETYDTLDDRDRDRHGCCLCDCQGTQIEKGFIGRRLFAKQLWQS